MRPFATGLSEPQLKGISTFIDMLQRWNARINLTAIRDPEEIVRRHWGESLFAAQHLLTPGGTLDVADVGSGAGFPGLALALCAPAARVTLIESQQRKATFLKEAARALTLTNINVFAARAEAWNDTADLVTLRAVERFADVLPAARKLVRPAGRLALLIGNAQTPEARKLAGFTWSEPLAVPQSRTRVLFVGTKPKS
jgi:16S rRNA (guanine527-N7)-methyltransferase